ncbi:MAG: aminotransferase class I/II-fold pyridoxal phosphate-dependent enzyme [Lachnospiraceae bacterium]|nr:aminotransferase class I/II-fold pyridoxal phosphate-dependent enzyme [Lachnospiraceae bacterium]
MTFDFDKKVDRLNTHSYKWDMLGEEYLPLWVADADFEVPPAVTERLQNRINHGVFGYFLTGNEIYDVLRNWFREEYNVKIPGKSWIRLVPGIVPALAVASNIGGGKSMTNIPNYCNLLDAPVSAGNVMIQVPLKNENEYYTIDFAALEAALTEDTKVFYLCNPHNPVGRVYSLEELQKVSAFAKKHNLLVVSDEAHCEVVFEGEHIPFFTVDEYAREHSITLYSNGKLCNVPDLILAFAIIPNKEIREEFERYAYAFGEEHVLNIEAGIATYAESNEWKKQLLAYLKANRDYLERELKTRFPKAKVVHLESTYLEWVDFRAYGEDIDAKFFKKYAKVFLTEGTDFGGEGYVRINFATRRAIITEALDRMEKALNSR